MRAQEKKKRQWRPKNKKNTFEVPFANVLKNNL